MMISIQQNTPKSNSRLLLEMENIFKLYNLEINVNTEYLTELINSFYKQDYNVKEVNYVIGTLFEEQFNSEIMAKEREVVFDLRLS